MVQFFLIYRLSVHVSSCPLTLPDVGQAILISTVVLVQAFLLSQYCFDADRYFIIAVPCMKMWWIMVRKIHQNINPVKKADLWHKSYYFICLMLQR